MVPFVSFHMVVETEEASFEWASLPWLSVDADGYAHAFGLALARAKSLSVLGFLLRIGEFRWDSTPRSAKRTIQLLCPLLWTLFARIQNARRCWVCQCGRCPKVATLKSNGELRHLAILLHHCLETNNRHCQSTFLDFLYLIIFYLYILKRSFPPCSLNCKATFPLTAPVAPPAAASPYAPSSDNSAFSDYSTSKCIFCFSLFFRPSPFSEVEIDSCKLVWQHAAGALLYTLAGYY